MGQYPYYPPGMKSKSYWAERSKESLSESFATTDEVAEYTRDLYEQSLTKVIKEYNKLVREYLVGNDLDMAALTKARTYDYNFLSKLQRLNMEIIAMSKELSDLQGEALKEALIDVYIANSSNLFSSFGLKNTYLFNRQTVEASVTQPWTIDGREFSNRIWQNTELLSAGLRETISQAVMNGESIDKTVRKFKKLFGNSDYNTRRIIRTETMAVHCKSSIESYKKLGLDRLRVLTEADACDECKEHSNESVSVDLSVVGVNIPPFHPFCKCCVAPLIDTSNW